jgi:hypothetical protein
VTVLERGHTMIVLAEAFWSLVVLEARLFDSYEQCTGDKPHHDNVGDEIESF